MSVAEPPQALLHYDGAAVEFTLPGDDDVRRYLVRMDLVAQLSEAGAAVTGQVRTARSRLHDLKCHSRGHSAGPCRESEYALHCLRCGGHKATVCSIVSLRVGWVFEYPLPAAITPQIANTLKVFRLNPPGRYSLAAIRTSLRSCK
jgi:hypothetical protein